MDHQLLQMQGRSKTSKELFKLEDISAVRTWDYSLPTVTIEKRFTERKPWTHGESFREALFEKYKILECIDLEHLAIMGGSVLSLVTNEFETKDVDIFVVTGKNNKTEGKEFASARIRRFIDDIYKYMSISNNDLKELQEKKQRTKPEFTIPSEKLYKLDEFRVRRVHNVFTVEVPVLRDGPRRSRRLQKSLTIQLISTPYETLSSLFQHADLDCTALAYFDNELWLSERAKFGLENLSFVVDGNKSSPAYIERVIKYFDRGFDVILPSLDVTKIRTNNFAFDVPEVLDLPHLVGIVRRVQDNKIYLDKLQRPPQATSDAEDIARPSTAFESYDIAQSRSSLPTGVIIHKSIISLINGKYDDFIVDGEGANYVNAFRPRPYITDRMLVNTYETVKSSIWSDNGLNVRKLVEYFTVLSPTGLIEKALTSYVAQKEAQGKATSSFFDASFDAHVKNVLEELVNKQVDIAKEKLKQLETIEFTPKNVEDRFVEMCTPVEFFGKYVTNDNKRRRLE